MSRLRQLNDVVTGTDSEGKAIALVKSVLPNQAQDIDKPSLGTEAGVRNCSLIAEFIVTYFTQGKVRYGEKISGGGMPSMKKRPAFDLKSVSGDPMAMVGEFGGHNVAILRESNVYALYQAWEGQYHVFPRLNEDGESHNIFGSGEDTIALINKEVAYLEGKTGTQITVKMMT